MEQNFDPAQLRGIIKRRKAGAILAFAATFTLIAAVALLLPNIYRSSATIMIENPQLPPNLVTASVTTYADQRIQGITQEITSRGRILNLVKKYDLLPDKRERLATEDLVTKIQKRITVETIDAEIKKETLNKPALITIAFTLSYDDENPDKAQHVADELSSYYMEKNHEDRAKYARNASQFLEDQLRGAKERLDGLEAKLANYREAHLEELPEFTALNMQKIEKMSADISNLNMQIRLTDEQRSIVRTRLAEIDPFGGMGPMGQVLSVQERMKQAQLEEANLSSRYSEQHPMVQAKKHELELLGGKSGDPAKTMQIRARLSQLESELADLKSRYSDKHPAVNSKIREIERVKGELQASLSKASQPEIAKHESATNPAYIALKSDAEKADVTLAAMKIERARLEEQLKSVYEKMHSMPQVTKEYNEMDADYQNAKANLTDLQLKLASARLSQGMEDEQLGETFKVIEPAFFPEKPAKPNRLAILLIGIVLAMGVSIGTASFLEYSDTRVHDTETVERLSGLSVFSTIPRIVTAEDIKRTRRKRVLIATGTVAGIVAAVLLFHYFVMDVDVFWARLIRLIDRKTML
jgi:uncharacterized protein involved in exopolysaccharide biosynthesis